MTRPHLYWSVSFRIRQYVKGSLWVVPLVGGLAGYALGFGATWAERAGDLPDAWTYSPSTALTVLTTVVGATVGLTGFVVTVSVLVVQMATGTFSARYMRLWYRDRILKAVLAVLIGTFIFSYSLLRRVENPDTVPNLGVSLCGFFLGAGIVLFLVFLDRAVHRLRPVAVAALVSRAGRKSLRSVAAIASSPGRRGRRRRDPGARGAGRRRSSRAAAGRERSRRSTSTGSSPGRGSRTASSSCRTPSATSSRAGRRSSRCTATVTRDGQLERSLGRMVALGVERTIDQDPAFALRILVDVAIRALSPAVNDPTTATQVLDHLEDTLALIGTTPGLDGRWEFHDADGRLRVVMPAQRWDDYLSLGVTEIREYGATAIQVVRRLRAMLLELRELVLPEYVPAVERELARLERTARQSFGDSVDLELAGTCDRQGIGGPRALV